MKTLADFKRALKVGSSWHTYHDLDKRELGLGVISRVQSNGVYFKRLRQDLDGVKEIESFMDFPKADLFEINKDGSASIFWAEDQAWNLPRRKVLTYKEVEA